MVRFAKPFKNRKGFAAKFRRHPFWAARKKNDAMTWCRLGPSVGLGFQAPLRGLGLLFPEACISFCTCRVMAAEALLCKPEYLPCIAAGYFLANDLQPSSNSLGSYIQYL